MANSYLFFCVCVFFVIFAIDTVNPYHSYIYSKMEYKLNIIELRVYIFLFSSCTKFFFWHKWHLNDFETFISRRSMVVSGAFIFFSLSHFFFSRFSNCKQSQWNFSFSKMVNTRWCSGQTHKLMSNNFLE